MKDYTFSKGECIGIKLQQIPFYFAPVIVTLSNISIRKGSNSKSSIVIARFQICGITIGLLAWFFFGFSSCDLVAEERIPHLWSQLRLSFGFLLSVWLPSSSKIPMKWWSDATRTTVKSLLFRWVELLPFCKNVGRVLRTSSAGDTTSDIILALIWCISLPLLLAL